jgi:cytochrome c oxidase cbb3-type subunit 1
MTIRHVPRAVPDLDYPTSSEAMEPAVPVAE